MNMEIRKILSKTKIENRLRKKTNPILVKAIINLKKTNPEVAKILAMPKKKQVSLNLDEIDKAVKAGDKILVPGKVLSSGELTKNIKLVAWAISEKAQEKLKQKAEFVLIINEMKKNPELKDLKILM